MCRTQKILNNIQALQKQAISDGNLDLVEKLILSYNIKKAKMVKPKAILQSFDNVDILVKEILSFSPQKVQFIGTCNGVDSEFDQTDVFEFIKDSNSKAQKSAFPKPPHYTSLRKHTLDEFVYLCSQMFRISPRKRQWLKLIAAKKLQCPVTDLKVSYCSYDITPMSTYHYNFYSEDGQLFTVDHIIPKSKGGSEMKLKNLQPMIGKYNWRKGTENNNKYLLKMRKS